MHIIGEKTSRKLWLAVSIGFCTLTISVVMIFVSFLAEDWNSRIPRFFMATVCAFGVFASISILNFGIKHYKAAPSKLEIEITDDIIRIGDKSISFSPDQDIRIDVRSSSVRSKRFSVFVFKNNAPAIEDHGNFIHTLTAMEFAKGIPSVIKVKLFTPFEQEVKRKNTTHN